MSISAAIRNRFRYDNDNPWSFYLKVILCSFIVGFCVMMPSVIYEWINTGSGVFLYYGDYNAQQIPFYRHCVEMVHSGSFGWDWNTDLGANFTGSYSYYMLGSPFFWVMALFPSSWVPYLMAPMYIFKYTVASVFAYCYLQRFVKNKNFAVIGALLYSFSGFQIYNTFFNQFHDVVALFPLLLIGIEELVQNDRKGLFALAVMLNAMVNYFMFIGQVVFCLIYFFFRVTDKSFRVTLAKFGWICFEGITGVLMSMFLFLPAVLALSGNTRTGTTYTETVGDLFSNLFKGKFESAWLNLKKLILWTHNKEFYWQRYGQILESYFFPPDIPSRVNFFYGHETRWASISAYLPLFSLSGVFALFTVKGRKWLKKLMIFLTVCSLFPILNSMFFLFNTSYYARWYYMLTMTFVLATVISLDDAKTKWRVPTAIMTFGCTAFAVPLGLYWYYSKDSKDRMAYKLGYPPFIDRFWIWVALAFAGIVTTAWLIRRFRGTKKFERAALVAVCVMTVVYANVHIIYGKAHSHASDFLVDNCVEGEVNLPDPHEGFYRIDFYRTSSISTLDNLGIYWEYPSIECFHTVVPPSIMEFYPKIGVTRSVGSRAESSYYGLRAFTSTKYSFIRTSSNKGKWKTETVTDPDTGETVTTEVFSGKHNAYGFTYLETQNDFDIYVNDNYLPMGFAYTEFMTESDFEAAYSTKNRHMVLCKYLVVPDGMEDYYSEFMTKVTKDTRASANKETFSESVEERRSMACDEFSYSSSGFDAHITVYEDSAVFFSVPYEEGGWTATVNGEEAEVLKATYGFVAVKCEAGENDISFSYHTPGFLTAGTVSIGETSVKFPLSGIQLSAIGFALYAAYLIIFKIVLKQRCKYGIVKNTYYDEMKLPEPEPDTGSEPETDIEPDQETDVEPEPDVESEPERETDPDPD
ncbi:MAG: YfhO family protein, partial [Clostridia bacterium]|nr:YfhO family protein [Clostridia bacterium]